MPNGLITLHTDLKSLKYGTMPLGSDKPYVTKNIGQAPGSQIGAEISHRIDDVSRIAQMLVDKPGIKYLLHEAELQQVNVAQKIKKAQTQKGGNKSLVGAVLGQIGSTIVGTTKIAASTLAQVPVNGTGTHFLKGFRTDTYLQPSNGNQASGFAQFFGAGGIEGAQYALRGEEVPGEHETELTGISSKYDYDDYINQEIPQGSVESRTLAESGKPITIPGPQWETTAQPYELGRSNQIKEADEGELLADNSGYSNIGTTYSPYNTFTGTSTEDAIRNTIAGAPIPTQFTRETTEKIKGSLSSNASGQQIVTIPSGSEFKDVNTFTDAGKYREKIRKQTTISDVEGTPIELSKVKHTLDDNGIGGKQKYTTENTYTGNTSEDTTARAIGGKKIIAHKNPAEYPYFRAVQQDFSTAGGGAGSGIFTKGEESIPKPTKLENLQTRINAGSETIVSEDINVNSTIQDFREGSTNIYSFDYNSATVHKEQRVSLGNQGKSSSKTNYMAVDPQMVDKVNALDISSTLLEGVTTARDFAKFYFEIITPDGSKFLYFRAFIDSIDDGYTADWQARKYNGRAENFYTYGGFDRDISISFNVAAASRSEMKPLYKKMVYLASATAPTYGTSGLMRGTLARITVGSYLSQIPGVLTSVKFTLDNNTPWEIAMGNPDGGEGSTTDDDVQELPMLLKCSISFKPIHDFAPQTGLHHYFTNPKPLNGSNPFFTDGQAI